jgi:hypothetical protein
MWWLPWWVNPGACPTNHRAAPTWTFLQSQRDLIKALKATGKPLVLVLMNGRPLSIL